MKTFSFLLSYVYNKWHGLARLHTYIENRVLTTFSSLDQKKKYELKIPAMYVQYIGASSYFRPTPPSPPLPWWYIRLSNSPYPGISFTQNKWWRQRVLVRLSSCWTAAAAAIMNKTPRQLTYIRGRQFIPVAYSAPKSIEKVWQHTSIVFHVKDSHLVKSKTQVLIRSAKPFT